MDVDTEARVYTVSGLPDKPSSSTGSSFKKVKGFGSAVLAVSLGFWLIVLTIAVVGAIPLSQLIVGSLFKNACSMNYLIPIYLIVAGVVGLVQAVISVCQNLSQDTNCCLCFNGLLGLFNFAWFIAGSVWVFRVKSIVQFNNPDVVETYCNGTVYNCAFVTLIITYVLLGLLICCGCLKTCS